MSDDDTAGDHKPGLTGAGLRYARVLVETARNAAEVARFGGLDTGEQSSPFTVVSEQLHFRLRHYFADDVPTDAPAIVLVPPLMIRADVWDVSPSSSAVSSLHASGIDVWVVDFGDPGHEPGGLERTLTDHVLAVSAAVEQVAAAVGRSVVLAGYSQGGMFVYQAAAYRRGRDIDSVVTFGSPVDARAPLPLPISPELATRAVDSLLASGLLEHVRLPSWASRTGFKLLAPMKTVQGRAKFLLSLHDRDALMPRERQRKFLEVDGFTDWSGPAIAELLELFVAHNRMVAGGIVIGDHLVTLADLDMPILTCVGTSDTLGHPDSVRAIRRAAPRAQVYELTLKAGHFGLVVGSTANDHTWPAVASWVAWRSGHATLPSTIVPAEQVEVPATVSIDAGTAALTQAAELGLGAGLLAAGTARRAVRAVAGLIAEAPIHLPRLARMGQLDPATRMSIGLLLDEQARRFPTEVALLFGDRALQQAELKSRVDSVVRGLISVGVRHGDRVGVLMDTRPSALSVIAALSRLGATSVLLRPDGDLPREVALGEVTRIVSDPEHVGKVDQVDDSVAWCVLGGGAEDRDLDPRVLDMERIDPAHVELPEWYRPNPHQAGDLAFILFTGSGAGTRTVPVTNHRWALSALGTAAAAALKPGDTVYSTTPIHHTSAVLMSVGGAVAGGARFALASAHDPDTFWDEVRRYGATHVSYTWTSLRDVTHAPPNPAEQHHPIRIFMGSGMPANLWRRVSERFPGTRVLEFYAAADGDAILGNVEGVPIGSMGRPLPGTATVRIAAFDPTARRLALEPTGLARECGPDEVGLLLSQVRSTDARAGSIIRSLFEPGDAWRSTGDLFTVDARDEYWFVDSVAALVDTPRGTAAPAVTRRALEQLPAVDLCVTYAVGPKKSLVCAATLRDGMTLNAADLEQAFERLAPEQWPDYVQVVPEIEVTTWHRPVWSTLRKSGVPKPSRRRSVWRLAGDDRTYEELAPPRGSKA